METKKIEIPDPPERVLKARKKRQRKILFWALPISLSSFAIMETIILNMNLSSFGIVSLSFVAICIAFFIFCLVGLILL